MQPTEIFSISPGTNIMDVLGHSGYSFDFAIADLIDNCLAAKASKVKLYFDVKSKAPYLYILDDGVGMSLSKIKEAAVIGFEEISKQRSNEDLGRFSTGLKSAAKSFCENMYICSKQEGLPASTVQLDFKHIKKSKKWEAFVVSNPALESLIENHGTVIYCTDLTVFNSNSTDSDICAIVDDLELALSHIYGKYILSKRVEISLQFADSKPIIVNGWNPFELPHNKSTKKVYENKIEYKNYQITLRAFVLPVYSNLDNIDQQYMNGRGLIDQQGYYVYRNDRLIYEGGWLNLQGLNLDDKSKYARVEVNIPSQLDEEFKINFSKNSLVVPVELQNLFKEVAKKVRTASRSSANYLKHPELKPRLKSDDTKVWKTSHSSMGTVLTINDDHPLIAKLCQGMNQLDRTKLFQLLSKTIPIRMIQEQGLCVDSYSEKDIFDLTDNMYNNLKSQGLSLSDIKKRFTTLEPFKDHINVVIEYFEKLEEENK